MKKIMPFVLCCVVLGCASEVEIRQRAYDKEMSQANAACDKSYDDADLGELRKKINYTSEQTILEYLANNTYATESDKPYILMNDKLSRACWKTRYDITLKNAGYEYAIAVKDASTTMAQNRANLYNGKITYGEYNKLSIELTSKLTQIFNALDNKAMNQAMQEKQQYINAMQLYRPIPYNAQMPQRNNVYCNTFGSNTNCTSY